MTRNVTIAAVQLPIWTEGETDVQRKRFRVEALMHGLEEASNARAALACLAACRREPTLEASASFQVYAKRFRESHSHS